MRQSFSQWRFRFLVTFVIAAVTSGCVTTTIAGRKFMKDTGKTTGNNPAERGFMVVDHSQPVCGEGGTKRIKAGYYVRPREPRAGERESDYKTYFNAERHRTAVCAEVGLWCASKASLFCRLDDEECLARQAGGAFNTCFAIMPSEIHPDWRPIVTTWNRHAVISCATDSRVGYMSPLHFESHSRYGWSGDRAKWREFCAKHRPVDECDRILQIRGTYTGAQPITRAPFDFPRHAVEVIKTNSVDVHEDDGAFWAEIDLDIGDACSLLEKRY